MNTNKILHKVGVGTCAGLLALTLAACGGNAGSQRGAGAQKPAQEAPANDLESSIAQIQADFEETAQTLLDEQAKMFEEVGDTYEDYRENVDKVQAWYDLAVSETEALGERTVERGRAYYQLVVELVDVTDDKELEKATEDLYDAVYDDAFDDYYDAIYEDAFDDAYDQYYDGILDDAYDVTPYDEWYDARSDAYEMYFDARSDVYEAIFDARSDFYSDYLDVRSAFYSNDFDVEGLFAPVQTKERDTAKDEEGDEGVAGAAADASAASAEFTAIMDGYEVFFDEYIAFMERYKAGPSDEALIAESTSMLARYTETMAALDDIDPDSLSAADYAYYIEATGRIAEKLTSVA